MAEPADKSDSVKPVCQECGNVPPLFSVRSEGYPSPMRTGLCHLHLGSYLAADLSHPGSTCRWIVEAQ